MQNDYTNSEICRIYRNQKNRSRGVQILIQITGWSPERIEQILTDGGYTDFKNNLEETTNEQTKK